MTEERIKEILAELSVDYVEMVRINDVDRQVLLEISVDRVHEHAHDGFTTTEQLKRLEARLTKLSGLDVVVAIMPSQRLTDFETGLRAALKLRHTEIITDTYVTFPNCVKASTEVHLLKSVGQDVIEAIKNQVENYLHEGGIASLGVSFVQLNGVEPNLIQILRALKVLSPVALSDLAAYLAKKGYSLPSERWLAAKLDAARKRGILLRQGNSTYVLTAAGLAAVPFTTSRNSSDVERMLYLSRRIQW